MEEKMRILNMVEEGKINAREALELLEALGNESEQETQKKGKSSHASLRGRKLKIIITEAGQEKPKVNVRLPLRLVQWAERFIPSEAKQEMEQQGIYLEEILNSMDEFFEGDTIVDVENDITGEKILVVIE